MSKRLKSRAVPVPEVHVSLPMTEAERAKLQRLASAEGRSMLNWLRWQIIRAPEPADPNGNEPNGIEPNRAA